MDQRPSGTGGAARPLLPQRRSGASGGLAAGLVLWSALWYLAYGWTTATTLDAVHRPSRLAVLVATLAALWVAALLRPLGTSLLLLACLPLFGNHPGGRLMEVVNLPLAAAGAGLALQAWRRRQPTPSGWIWLAAAVYVASAATAFVASLPGVMVRAAALNDWPTALRAALTASEDDPLYALSSLVGLTLCAGWSAALAWRAPGEEWFLKAVRVLMAAFFVVVGIGILDYHGVLNVTRLYQLRVDPRPSEELGFQSVFWNPGWFAWYFVMVFALALGFLWSARPRERRLVAGLLAVSAVYFLGNPQRAGFLVIVFCTALAAAVHVLTSPKRRTAGRTVAIVFAVVLVAVLGAYELEYIPHTGSSSLFRLLAAPRPVQLSDSIRAKLWAVAVRMWRDAPLFGLGEGSFAWQFGEYARPRSGLFTKVHGDAHNTWLQILATRGAFGVVAFGALLWALARQLRERGGGWPSRRGLVIGLGLALAGFTVYSTVQGMFYLQCLQILFWFLVAATAAKQAGEQDAPRRRWAAPALAAALGLALAAQTVLTIPAFAEARARTLRQPRGFYPVEGDGTGRTPWRWSVREGTLCLERGHARVRVRVRAADPRPLAYPRTVTLGIDGTVVDTVRVPRPSEFTRVLPLPPSRPSGAAPRKFGECSGRDGDVRLTVTVDRTWSPLSAGVGLDPRTLGVVVFEPSYPD
jgi:hypothetical protein